ncbi:TRCF domain-containing protein [Shigella boydii]
MTTDAQKRLEAIASLEDFGAGFALATPDLQMRGAGELLAKNKVAQWKPMVFAVYGVAGKRRRCTESRTRAVAGRFHQPATEVELRMPSLLPDDFIPDVNTRLSFYKRIASAKTENELKRSKSRLSIASACCRDPARTLLDVARLRQQARRTGIRKLEGNEKGGVIEFAEKITLIRPGSLVCCKQPQHYRLDGPTRQNLFRI